MKKTRGILFLFVCLCMLTTLTACSIVDDDNRGNTAPTVKKSSAGDAYNISFNSVEGMLYANIFRYDVKADTEDKKITNIGQVIPKDTNKLPNSFQFEDQYQSGSSERYRYFVRYYDGSYYTYTRSSPVVQGLGSEDAVLYVDDSDTSTTSPVLLYDNNTKDDSYTLILQNDISTNVSAEDLYVVVSNGSQTKPYKMYTFTDDVVPAGTETTDLRIFLLSSFLGKTLTIPYLIGVKTDTTINENYTSYYWTLPLSVTLKEKEYKEESTQITEVTDIIVPVITDRTNDFDYSGGTSNPYLSVAAKSAHVMQTMQFADDVVLDFSPYQP